VENAKIFLDTPDEQLKHQLLSALVTCLVEAGWFRSYTSPARQKLLAAIAGAGGPYTVGELASSLKTYAGKVRTQLPKLREDLAAAIGPLQEWSGTRIAVRLGRKPVGRKAAYYFVAPELSFEQVRDEVVTVSTKLGPAGAGLRRIAETVARDAAEPGLPGGMTPAVAWELVKRACRAQVRTAVEHVGLGEPAPWITSSILCKRQ